MPDTFGKEYTMDNEYTIDLGNVFSVDELHDVLREELPMPEYYGGTLDALYDVLTDEGQKWHITFTGCSDAEAILGKYFRNLKKMFERATGECPDLEIILID